VQRLDPGVVQKAERDAFLLMLGRSVPRGQV